MSDFVNDIKIYVDSELKDKRIYWHYSIKIMEEKKGTDIWKQLLEINQVNKTLPSSTFKKCIPLSECSSNVPLESETLLYSVS